MGSQDDIFLSVYKNLVAFQSVQALRWPCWRKTLLPIIARFEVVLIFRLELAGALPMPGNFPAKFPSISIVLFRPTPKEH